MEPVISDHEYTHRTHTRARPSWKHQHYQCAHATKTCDIRYYYYLLYQLGTGGRTQKAQPIQGVYP